MSTDGVPLVLRDVLVRGEVLLPHRRGSLAPVAAEAEPAASRHAAERPATLASIEDEARRRGYEEGFAQGCAEGRKRGNEEAAQLATQASEQAARELEARTDRMTQELAQQAQARYQARLRVVDGIISALPSQVEARLAAAEDDMLALCFETICRVLGERAVQPDMVRAQLALAADALRNRELVAVHLHPDDLAALQRDGGAMPAGLGGGEIQWIPSADVALGGCLLQSAEGGLDARLETQLQALRELLRQSRAALQAEGAST
jgi:flagellar assembly protein FliH